MVAAVADLDRSPAVAWREVRCREKRCRTLLFRYRVPGGGNGARVLIETVCPDRRCRRAQTVELPHATDVLR